MKNIGSVFSENFQFLEVKFSIYMNRRVFVMGSNKHYNKTMTSVCLGYELKIFQL